MQAGDDAAQKLLFGAAQDLRNAEQKLAVATTKISDANDEAEVKLLTEEAADVRVRVDAAATRSAPQ